MIIEKFYRNITEDPHWVMVVKAKWSEHTTKYLISFESYMHPDFLSETFVCVRVWENENPHKPFSREHFLTELNEMKKRNEVQSVIDLYQVFKNKSIIQ